MEDLAINLGVVAGRLSKSVVQPESGNFPTEGGEGIGGNTLP